jgi:transposase
MISELAEQIGAPESTVYNWVQKGRLSSRSIKVGGVNAKLVTADAPTIANLKAARATPLPWRRLPPPRSYPFQP